MLDRIFMPKNSDSLNMIYLWTILAGLTYAGSSFVISLATSNVLGAEISGTLTIAMAIGNQLVTVGHYNMRTFQVSDVIEKYSFSDYCASRIMTVGAMLLGGVGWVLIKGYTKEKALIVGMLVLFKAGEAVSELFEGRYQQKERYDVSCRVVFFKTVLYLGSFILCLVLTHSLLIATTVLAFVYLLAIAIIDGRLVRQFEIGHITFRWDKQKKLMMACLPLFINAFLTAYILNGSKYAMERYYSGTLTGTFNVLYMMAFVINLFASFMLKPLLSSLSSKYAHGDIKGFAKMMKWQFWAIVGITFVCLGGAYVLGTLVLSMLSGIDLSSYRMELCIMLAGGAFTALYQLFQYAIVIMRHQFSSLVGCGVTAVLIFFITPVLVQRYAIMGAAISYLCSMTVMFLIFLCFYIYYLKKEE